MQHHLIIQKIDAISKELAETDDGLPPASISVGIAHGSDVTDVETLFEKTDATMYEAKQSGKNTYKFYTR
jgi:GGDEF domain-containing protein